MDEISPTPRPAPILAPILAPMQAPARARDGAAMAGRHLHLFGPGYAAQAVAAAARAAGARVSASLRDASRAPALRAAGIEPCGASDLPEGVTDLLISAPPGPGGCPGHAALCAASPALRARLRWIGYYSSTAVYGDRQGAWITEDAAPAPVSADARARLQAEMQWQALAAEGAVALDVLRIAGIYGPAGRNVLGQLRSGTARAIVKPGQVFNRIHRDDIVGATLAAMIGAVPGLRVTNLADGAPCAASDLLIGVAQMLDLPPPPQIAFAEAGLPTRAAAFYAENRRLANDRLRALPGFALRHPDWRSGYAAIIAGGE